MVNQRDVNQESIYEYGSRSGVWRIFRLFKEQKVPCTAYACGMALEVNPEVAKGFEAGGHEIASHGYRWIDRSQQTAQEELDNVKKAVRGQLGVPHDFATRSLTRSSLTAIKKMSPSSTPPCGWYYGHVESEGGARSRGLVAQGFAEEGVPLK